MMKKQQQSKKQVRQPSDVLFSQYTSEELASSFVFPVQLTKAQQREAALALQAFRKKHDGADAGIKAGLYKLRFLIEDVLSGRTDLPEADFAYFLKNYLQLAQCNQKQLAAALGFHESFISQILHGYTMPTSSFFMRLDIHSGGLISATHWFRLHAMYLEKQFFTNPELRKSEGEKVKAVLITAPE